MKRLLRLGAVSGLLLLGVAAVSEWTGAGRRLWYPYWVAVAGSRTHAEVLADLRPRYRPQLKEGCEALGLDYPPRALTLVGLKQEGILEVWARAGESWQRLRSYPIRAASGGPGPKRRQGDGQVPEGIYRLTNFNPNSSYHLSVRVDYPNDDDRAAARIEGRSNLGGDIYVHGKNVSIGCLAMGDTTIEELYVLLADVGLSRTRILLTPSVDPQPASDDPPWIRDLYTRLRQELSFRWTS